MGKLKSKTQREKKKKDVLEKSFQEASKKGIESKGEKNKVRKA